jgi:hypothetical protein
MKLPESGAIFSSYLYADVFFGGHRTNAGFFPVFGFASRSGGVWFGGKKKVR